MPTTTLVDSTFSANVIGARTNNAGAAVTNTTAEEARLLNYGLLTTGYLTPSTAYQVTAQSVPNMTVKVGSGNTKNDHYLLNGAVAGQGAYVVRLDIATQNVTISPADASQTRTDEIYVLVQDNAYDSSARALPRIGYRQGDLGGANPGPDATWQAYALLARITVAATVTSILNANITDMRASAQVLPNIAVPTARQIIAGAGLSGGGALTADRTLSVAYGTTGGTATQGNDTRVVNAVQQTLLTAKGDLVVASAASTPTNVAVGTNGQVFTADSAQAAGTKWATPTHTLIGEVLLGSITSVVTFTSIPQIYKHLLLLSHGITTGASLTEMQVWFNGDVAASYDTQYMQAAGTAVTGARSNSTNSIDGGACPPNSVASSSLASEMLMIDYTNTTSHKTTMTRGNFYTAVGGIVVWQSAGSWFNDGPGAITQISLTPAGASFAIGSRFSLFGIT